MEVALEGIWNSIRTFQDEYMSLKNGRGLFHIHHARQLVASKEVWRKGITEPLKNGPHMHIHKKKWFIARSKLLNFVETFRFWKNRNRPFLCDHPVVNIICSHYTFSIRNLLSHVKTMDGMVGGDDVAQVKKKHNTFMKKRTRMLISVMVEGRQARQKKILKVKTRNFFLSI